MFRGNLTPLCCAEFYRRVYSSERPRILLAPVDRKVAQIRWLSGTLGFLRQPNLRPVIGAQGAPYIERFLAMLGQGGNMEVEMECLE